jgi:hypothetical protein
MEVANAIELPIQRMEEEEEEEVPLIGTSSVKQTAKANGTKAAAPAKGKTKSKAKSGGRTAKAKAKAKKAKEESDMEETIVEVAPPVRTRASTVTSNQKKAPTRPLALPTANVPPRPSDILVPPPVAQQPFTSPYEGSSDGFGSDSDADMEPVQPDLPAAEDGDEIDPEAFALELDEGLMTDEETPGVDVDTFRAGAGTGPVSLNQYAGGKTFRASFTVEVISQCLSGQGAQDEDDYSSSEEDSDD